MKIVEQYWLKRNDKEKIQPKDNPYINKNNSIEDTNKKNN